MKNKQIIKPYAILPNCEIRAIEGIIGSLGKRQIPIVGLSSDPNCTAFYSRFLTKRIVSPDLSDENRFLEFLYKKVPKGVLFTSNDQTAILFARNIAQLKNQGFLLNLPTTEQLIKGFDKWQCYLFAKELGIPVPSTFMIRNKDDAISAAKQLGFPHLIKATRLGGGNYIRIKTIDEVVPSYVEMDQGVNASGNLSMHSGLISQEWLEYNTDDIWCVQAFYDKDGKSVGFWPSRKWRTLVVKDGTYGSRFFAGESSEQKVLVKSTKMLLDALNWQGFAHLDWVYVNKKNTFYLNEINPRLPGFSIFPSHGGFAIGYFYYADLIGEEFSIPPFKKTIYLELLRHPGDFTMGLLGCLRDQYSLTKFLKSYKVAFFGRVPLVVDFFDRSDIRPTAINLLKTIKYIGEDFISFCTKTK
jgi:predicted ATP-grasp superfamily ATP-dependent carboligase